MLLMETAICDSELSQLSFSTISAHSANAQPFQKRKRSLIFRDRKKPKAEKQKSLCLTIQNIETSRRKLQTTSAQWPGCFCKQMSRSNTCRKLRKCAKNPSGPDSYLIWTNKYFLRQQFSAAIGAAHFPAVETGD